MKTYSFENQNGKILVEATGPLDAVHRFLTFFNLTPNGICVTIAGTSVKLEAVSPVAERFRMIFGKSVEYTLRRPEEHKDVVK